MFSIANTCGWSARLLSCHVIACGCHCKRGSSSLFLKCTELRIWVDVQDWKTIIVGWLFILSSRSFRSAPVQFAIWSKGHPNISTLVEIVETRGFLVLTRRPSEFLAASWLANFEVEKPFGSFHINALHWREKFLTYRTSLDCIPTC